MEGSPACAELFEKVKVPLSPENEVSFVVENRPLTVIEDELGSAECRAAGSNKKYVSEPTAIPKPRKSA